MTDSERRDAEKGEDATPRPPTARWVKVVLVLVATVVLVLIAVVVFGGDGQHGPGRHGLGPDGFSGTGAGFSAVSW